MLSLHPGEYIAQVYLEFGEITKTDLAMHLDVAPSTVSRILNKKMDITPSMALRLSHVLGRTPESWLDMQMQYSLQREKESFDSSQLKKLSGF